MEQQRLRPARSSITLPPLNEKKAITNESLPQINNNNNISSERKTVQNKDTHLIAKEKSQKKIRHEMQVEGAIPQGVSPRTSTEK